MTDEPGMVSVSQKRVDQLVKLLSFVAVGEIPPDNLWMDLGDEDDAFSIIESTLSVLLRELFHARGENEKHIAVLQGVQQELEEKITTIEAQRTTIGELSTPIIEVWKDVLTLPIVGLVDSTRAAQMMDMLLDRVVEKGSRCVIIDLTGVDVVDTASAAHFIQMIRACQLLGTYCVVTGVSSRVAQTMVQLGIDLGGVITLGTLKDGLRHCLLYLQAKQ